METVEFTRMIDGTRDEYLLLREREEAHIGGTAARILREMARQDKETLTGYRVTRLEHALQSATRAYRDGADVDWVVGALLHDIGDGLAPANHDRFAAEVVRPFLREEVTWVIAHHGVFQLVYYAHHLGSDPNGREQYSDHPCYRSCVDFCARWDQASFDPAYGSEPLAVFEPMVREVFARKAYDAAHTLPGVVLGVPPSATAAE